jgi:uncharacterized protein YPO0396
MLDDADATDEARFARIAKLAEHLRDEPEWRARVIDVRRWFDFAAREFDTAGGKEIRCYTDGAGQSGGEKAKLAFTVLAAAIADQYDIDPARPAERFGFVVIDEMFSKVDDRHAEYTLRLTAMVVRRRSRHPWRPSRSAGRPSLRPVRVGARARGTLGGPDRIW